jgi:hypothetical protein
VLPALDLTFELHFGVHHMHRYRYRLSYVVTNIYLIVMSLHMHFTITQTLLSGDGRLGYPDMAPYDAIHVGAAAPEVPQALLDQLKVGGRLVIPVRFDLFSVTPFNFL